MKEPMPPKYIKERINPAYVDYLEKKIKHIQFSITTLDNMLKDTSINRTEIYGATLAGIKRII